MQTIAGSPFAWLTFDADGTLSSETPIEDVRRLATAPGITDIVVISHGWKNDAAEAHHLYETLWRNVVAALPSRAPDTIVVCGVRWPAKAFGADIDGAALQVGAQGGILSAPRRRGPSGATSTRRNSTRSWRILPPCSNTRAPTTWRRRHEPPRATSIMPEPGPFSRRPRR